MMKVMKWIKLRRRSTFSLVRKRRKRKWLRQGNGKRAGTSAGQSWKVEKVTTSRGCAEGQSSAGPGPSPAEARLMPVMQVVRAVQAMQEMQAMRCPYFSPVAVTCAPGTTYEVKGAAKPDKAPEDCLATVGCVQSCQ